MQFAPQDEWTSLCDTLASRLLAAGETLPATLCYICAGNIDKTIEIWSRTLAGKRDGKSYVDLLQVLHSDFSELSMLWLRHFTLFSVPSCRI